MPATLGTPLFRKLGIDRVSRVVASGAPADFGDLLGPLPDGVRLGTRLAGSPGLIIIFAERRTSMVDRRERAKA